VRLRKAAQDGRQRTWASITRAGRAAFRGHVAALQMLAGVVSEVGEAEAGGALPAQA
jgi:hypothetical protein